MLVHGITPRKLEVCVFCLFCLFFSVASLFDVPCWKWRGFANVGAAGDRSVLSSLQEMQWHATSLCRPKGDMSDSGCLSIHRFSRLRMFVYSADREPAWPVVSATSSRRLHYIVYRATAACFSCQCIKQPTAYQLECIALLLRMPHPGVPCQLPVTHKL